VYTLDTVSGKSAFSYRVGSSWDVGCARRPSLLQVAFSVVYRSALSLAPGPTPSFTHVGRKQSLPSPLPKLLKTSARWDVATIKAPDMAGQLGGTGGEGGFAVDLGKFHLSLPRLQATLEV